MTKDNWIKAFEKKFKNGWKFSKLITGEGVTESDIKSFISQVEKDAEERGYQLGLRDGIKKEHENSGAWTDLNKQGVINTHKLIKDAIDKTNKRWRLRVEKLKEKEMVWNNQMTYGRGEVAIHNGGRQEALSDLLEDKNL